MTRPIFIAAAGTGGHVYPALAVGSHLAARSFSLHWLGTRAGIEARVVPGEAYAMHVLPATGLRGRSFGRRMAALICALRSTVISMLLMIRHRPRVVLAMGGYVSGPVGIAAWLTRRHLIVHEQNAIPGFTNRIIGRFASQVLEAVAGSFPPRYRAVHVGNPIRAEIAQLAASTEDMNPRENSGSSFAILVFGGSQGARALNEAIPQALASLTDEFSVKVVHQCGYDEVDATSARYQGTPVDAEVVPFIDDMATAYRRADLVISRAGAISLAEIQAAALPSVLIPFPYAVDDHQTVNAQAAVDNGAAILISQRELTSERLTDILKPLLVDDQRRIKMKAAARKLARPDAAARVAELCQEASCG